MLHRHRQVERAHSPTPKGDGARASKAAKRLTDVCLAAAMLVVTLPVCVAAAVAIRLSMGAPVLFRQRRPGRHGRPFTLLKFRTMTPGGVPGSTASDAARLTRLGRLLRETSIDELPQLWNVLRGDMSVVGPRPLLMEYLPLYEAHQARRHEVLPGMTGWAQVNGRNALSWEQKFDLDVWYVDHRSWLLDLRIVALTVARVVRGHGVSQRGHATAEPFRGRFA